MKKFLTTLALAAFAAAASAGTAFTTYDVDYANAGQNFDSQNEVHVGAAFNTKYGNVDAAVVGRQLSPADGVRDNSYGVEVGYSKSVPVGAAIVTGRAALGRINHVDAAYGGFTGNTQYYSLAVEASFPVTEKLSVFTGYRFRDAFNSTGPIANRFTAGVDYTITQAISLRAGYAFTTQDGKNFNGLTAAVSYMF